MSQTVTNFVLLFFTTAFLGWVMEVVTKLVQYRRFINRGFLLGPYCPIYGFGSVLITWLLERYAQEPALVFILAMILCGTLEYVTSYAMEKLFHARWWDYSGKPFNLNGRVCAGTLIPFGLLGLMLVYVVKPFLFGLFAMMSQSVRTALSAALLALLLADAVISTTVLGKIRRAATDAKGDSTEAITRAVHAALAKDSLLVRRVMHAFPQMRLENRALLEKLKADRVRLRQAAKEAKAKWRDEMDKREARFRQELKDAKAKRRKQ